MGIGKGGHSLIAVRKPGKIRHNVDELPAYHLQSVPHDDDVRVIPHIAGGCPQVDDALCLRACHTVGVHMAHHVVAANLFPLSCHVVVDIVHIGFQLLHLGLGHRQPQLMLRPGKRHPQPPPGGEFLVRREEILHLRAGIPGAEGGLIRICIRHNCCSFKAAPHSAAVF